MGGDGGIVEIDETIYGRAATHPKGRGPSEQPGITNSAHKNVILSLVERGGSVRSYHVAGSTVGEVIPIVNANVAKEAAVMTDSAQLYKYRLGDFASHDRVDHSKDEYARYEEGRPSSTRTRSRATSQCSSAACAAPISTARRSICTAILRSSTFATTTARARRRGRGARNEVSCCRFHGHLV